MLPEKTQIFSLNFFPKFMKFENEVWIWERKWEKVKSREENSDAGIEHLSLFNGMTFYISVLVPLPAQFSRRLLP